VEEVALNLALETLHEAEKTQSKEAVEVDLFSLQPKRPNWDLKRDVERKLERLKPRTEAAVAKLVRIRLGGQNGRKEEGDLSKMVEMRERQQREESV
jgi:coiled-coil domain-containing protein 12